MLNSRFNVYKTEWLDLVFANRNQSYGAYDLRKNYDRTLTKALFTASFFFVGLICAPMIYSRFLSKTEAPQITTTADQPDNRLLVVTLKRLCLPAAPAQAAASAKPETPKAKVKTIRSTTPNVVPSARVTEELPTISELEHAVVAATSQSGTEGAINGSSGTASASGSGVAGGEGPAGEEILSPDMIEKYPEFPGGMEAFARYLQRNLRYPAAASDQGITGKVIVSFIVEKDGRLTDIKVLRRVGFGCDEEAVRVLKKSPVWSAGMQNNRKVRVQYTIPIVFQMD